MSDTDRLAALLIEVFPAANRNQWPFAATDVAAALIAAGVRVAPSPTEPPCGDDSWDTRYECVKPSGHPVEGPGLTSHEYRFKRATSRVAPSPETPGHRHVCPHCDQEFVALASPERK